MTDEPSDDSYSQLVERMAQLAGNDDQPVKDQHVLSEVVLKQFARPMGHGSLQTFKLCRFDLARGVSRQLTPGGAGYVQHFVKVASRSAEALWQTVETRLHDAIEACRRGSVFDEPKHVEAIKDALALHYARSRAVKQTHEKAIREAIANSAVRVRTQRAPMIRAAFVKQYGREPNDDELDEIAQLLSDRAAQQLDSDAAFRANVERLFDMARETIRGRALEVMRPVSGEFLIGDIPALTLLAGSQEAGIQGGIPLGSDSTIVMPLSPRLMASTGDVALYGKLDLGQVRYLNRKQVETAISHVHFRIGSRLEDFVRSTPRPTA